MDWTRSGLGCMGELGTQTNHNFIGKVFFVIFAYPFPKQLQNQSYPGFFLLQKFYNGVFYWVWQTWPSLKINK